MRRYRNIFLISIISLYFFQACKIGLNFHETIRREYRFKYDYDECSYNTLRRKEFFKKELQNLKPNDTLILILVSSLPSSSTSFDAIILNGKISYFHGFINDNDTYRYDVSKYNFTYPDSLINILKVWDTISYNEIPDASLFCKDCGVTYIEKIVGDKIYLMRPKILPLKWQVRRRVKGKF